jgi:hypothetical protein
MNISPHFLRADTREQMVAAFSAAGIDVDAETGELPPTGQGFDLFDLNANGCSRTEQYHVNLLLRGVNEVPLALAGVEIDPPRTPWCGFGA